MNARPSINLTDFLTAVIASAVEFSHSFRHVDIRSLLVCVSSNKVTGRGGSYGKLVPMRFRNGSEFLQHNRRLYTIPRVYHNDARILYLVYFYMPRFLDLPPREKLRVIFHELYHIDPTFNGDIRRMGAVKSAHGFSKKHFNSLFEKDASGFMESITGTEMHSILSMTSDLLYAAYETVVARRMKIPRPVMIDKIS
jgi:predicted metallopeptidase